MSRLLFATMFLAAVIGAGCASDNHPTGSLVGPGPIPTSFPQPIPQSNPLSISSVSPAAASAGGAAVTVTIMGAGFAPFKDHIQSFAVLGDTGLSTKYVSDTQLTAVIPARLLELPSSTTLSVVNGDSQGWSDGYRGYPRSNFFVFSVLDDRPH